MNSDYLNSSIHLHLSPDLSPVILGAALAIKQINTLIQAGGSHFNHPEHETSVEPQVISQFIDKARALGGPFADTWQRLQEELAQLIPIWEEGKRQFHEDLGEATKTDEIALLLASPTSALQYYAEPTAQDRYWRDHNRKQWFLNGYMLAHRQHVRSIQQDTDHSNEEI